MKNINATLMKGITFVRTNTLEPRNNLRGPETYFSKGVVSNQKTNNVNSTANNHHCRSKEWNSFPPLPHPGRQSCLHTTKQTKKPQINKISNHLS